MSKMQTLKCNAGHTWERPAQRGKPPKFCKAHAPAKAAKSSSTTTTGAEQTLTCAEGHTWTRPAQRGKPPRFCPQHKPAAPGPLSDAEREARAAERAEAAEAERIATWAAFRRWSAAEAKLTAAITRAEDQGDDASELRQQRIALFNPAPTLPTGPDPERGEVAA